MVHIPIATASGYDTENGAQGNCLEASDEFLNTLEDYGIPVNGRRLLREYIFIPNNKEEKRIQRADKFLKSFPFDYGFCNFHFVVKIDDFIIDWTARQFGADNPFPAIWKEPSIRKEKLKLVQP